jgi:molybdopterin converting factor subunit 1
VRVTIRLFARLREITGAGEFEREISAPADAQAAWEALTQEFPALGQYRPVISCAVNEQYAKFDTPLTDGDEVAFLPPVSGGGLGIRHSTGERSEPGSNGPKRGVAESKGAPPAHGMGIGIPD